MNSSLTSDRSQSFTSAESAVRCGLGILVLMVLAATSRAESKWLRVERTADPAGVRVDVDPGKGTGLALLQVVDAATGEVVRTLHAGPLTQAQSFTVAGGPAGLPAGTYKARYRGGVEVAFDAAIKRPDAKVPNWLNPTDVTRVGDAVYVFDAGELVPETRPEFLNEMTVNTLKEKQVITGRFSSVKDDVLCMLDKVGNGQYVSNFSIVLTPESIALVKKMEKGWHEMLAKRRERGPRIFKMDRGGKADTSFGENGALVLDPAIHLYYRAFGVDPASGNVLIGSGGHELLVFDRAGKPTPQTIGGWEAPPLDSKWCTPGPTSFAFGPNNRIYIPGGPYANGKVYDCTKSGHDGILYPFVLPECEGLDRYICGDGRGAFYTCGRAEQVTKHFDDGKAVKIVSTTTPELKLARPTGGCAGGGLVWWVCHGPGYGPFWDSGGGGEIVMFWDAGSELKLIDRFGVPGLAEDAVEFLNPSAVSVNAQQTEMWITEDGGVNKDGPKGNARVQRFLITARDAEEVLIEIK